MGLFDGQLKSFAKRFCDYLDGRVKSYCEAAEDASNGGNAYLKAHNLTIASVLNEVSDALKHVAEL